MDGEKEDAWSWAPPGRLTSSPLPQPPPPARWGQAAPAPAPPGGQKPDPWGSNPSFTSGAALPPPLEEEEKTAEELFNEMLVDPIRFFSENDEVPVPDPGKLAQIMMKRSIVNQAQLRECAKRLEKGVKEVLGMEIVLEGFREAYDKAEKARDECFGDMVLLANESRALGETPPSLRDAIQNAEFVDRRQKIQRKLAFLKQEHTKRVQDATEAQNAMLRQQLQIEQRQRTLRITKQTLQNLVFGRQAEEHVKEAKQVVKDAGRMLRDYEQQRKLAEEADDKIQAALSLIEQDRQRVVQGLSASEATQSDLFLRGDDSDAFDRLVEQVQGQISSQATMSVYQDRADRVDPLSFLPASSHLSQVPPQQQTQSRAEPVRAWGIVEQEQLRR